MFDVNFSEMMVVAVIALIVVGPERLPKVARTIGHLWGRAQRYVNSVKSDISRDMSIEEFRQVQQEIQQAASNLEQSIQQTGQTVSQQVQELDSPVAHPAPGLPEVPGLPEDVRREPQTASNQQKFPID